LHYTEHLGIPSLELLMLYKHTDVINMNSHIYMIYVIPIPSNTAVIVVSYLWEKWSQEEEKITDMRIHCHRAHRRSGARWATARGPQKPKAPTFNHRLIASSPSACITFLAAAFPSGNLRSSHGLIEQFVISARWPGSGQRELSFLMFLILELKLNCFGS
jgi:hypothetical protein